MSELDLFIPITKVDARQRLVYGIATAEREDRSGEICDYHSTKPLYEKWSQEIELSSGGKSRGNLRAMHGTVAAGKITALGFNDAAKQIEICAKVVDDAEWRKVEEGVYTGFSQGGTYARRWTDEDGRARYTAAPVEISLVDLPCLPQARFEMIKTDGSSVWRRFGPGSNGVPHRGLGKGLDLVAQFAELVDDLDDLQSATALEAAKEGDGSDVPAQLQDLLQRASAILRAMTAEETDELDDAHSMPPTGRPIASSLTQIAKIGARNSAADQDRVQSLHDMTVDLGAQCGTQKHLRGTLEKRFDALAGKIDDLLLRVRNIESQPLPLPLAGRARPVSKREDGGLHDENSVESLLADPDQLALLAIKMAQRNGRNIFPR
jgi:hypothetical protein